MTVYPTAATLTLRRFNRQKSKKLAMARPILVYFSLSKKRIMQGGLFLDFWGLLRYAGSACKNAPVPRLKATDVNSEDLNCRPFTGWAAAWHCGTLWQSVFFCFSYAVMVNTLVANAWRAVESGAMTGCNKVMYEHISQILLFRRTNPLTRSRGGDHRVSFLCVMRRAEPAKFMRKIGRLNVARLPAHKRRSLKGLSRYLRILPLPRQRCWVSPLSLSRSSLRKLPLTAVFCSTPSAVPGTTDGRRTTPPPARPPFSAHGRASTCI